ncbi:MAG: ribose-phosphate pyrophosphokinase [Deltaproteobacteria bacterium]|nr:MAG: ribose-phosphate pyrophosphokinase [Deltaproteobacteria bacterium]TMB32110.1 MAG: ribose-phosphate pyrophosphokinase [Deltaproteobacteria bacterium]
MPVHESDFVLFSGNSNQALAREVCEYLGQPLGKCAVTHFSDGETQVEIGENVRGRDVFLLQSTSTPVNDHLMELLILIDAARRASAEQITAVIPYFGYARQDRKVAPRTPITARLVADLITSAGADRFVSMDLHAGQIQGFFDMPSDHLYASPILLDHMRKTFPNPEEVVIISPDAGGVERARAFAKRLGTTLAIVDKRRSKPNVAEVMSLIGDVRGKTGVILDDMVDTAGTLTQGAKAVSDAGAKRVMAYAVHPVLSGPAIQRIEDSVIEKVVVTNTIPLSPAARESKKISQLSVAKIFGEAIRRIHEADSLSSLFV